jgi:hypothetical protein
MKLLSDLSSTRTNLLQVELLFQESGQLSALRVTVGLPLRGWDCADRNCQNLL